MSEFAHDTAPSEVEHYFELLRGLSPAQRLRAAGVATRRMRTFAEAGVRQRFPGASEAEVKVRLIELLYGREAAERLFGPESSWAR